MSKYRHKPEQIIAKLREVEVGRSKGTPVGQAVKKISVTDQTCYRWRKQYGGSKVDQAKRLKTLEQENVRLKRLLADAEPDKAVLKEAASGNYRARRSGVRRAAVEHARGTLGQGRVSERRACRVLGQGRATRYLVGGSDADTRSDRDIPGSDWSEN
ncbi:MAG TPA: transposase [Tepidisphaeraceae bacterium]|jgi:transposase-like protein